MAGKVTQAANVCEVWSEQLPYSRSLSGSMFKVDASLRQKMCAGLLDGLGQHGVTVIFGKERGMRFKVEYLIHDLVPLFKGYIGRIGHKKREAAIGKRQTRQIGPDTAQTCCKPVSPAVFPGHGQRCAARVEQKTPPERTVMSQGNGEIAAAAAKIGKEERPIFVLMGQYAIDKMFAFRPGYQCGGVDLKIKTVKFPPAQKIGNRLTQPAALHKSKKRCALACAQLFIGLEQ